MNFLVLSSKDNPKIKRLAKLLQSKKERAAEGVFVIEGMRGCIDAAREARGGYLALESLFIVPEERDAFSERLDLSAFDEIDERNVFEISRELADKISLEGNNQGAFVIARAVHKALPKKLDGDRYVVLDNIQDPGNLGTVLRTADAVGADGVILTNNCAELYNPKVIRSTVGSISRVNIYIENRFENVVGTLRASGVKISAAVVRNGEMLSTYKFSQRCAVVIGNEGKGLSDEHTALCDDRVTIDMHGRLDSLNASVAAAVIMWEMSKNG